MSPTVLPAVRRREGLTGAHVLVAFAVFFAAIFLMNGVMIYRAVSTNAGLVANEPYRKGLHYNARIAAEARQAALGWQETLQVTRDGGVSLALRDGAGQPVTGLRVELLLGRPASSREDARLVLAEAAPGRYEARTPPLAPGSWVVALEARAAADRGAEDPVYRLRRRLWLTP